MSVNRRSAVSGLFALTLALGACSGASPQSASPPAARPASGGEAESAPVQTVSTEAEPDEGGGESAGAEEPSPMVQLDAFSAELTARTSALADALAAVDCDGAATHRDLICQLAGRICGIAEQHPETEAADRCSDAGARCERATDDVAGACD